MPDNPPPNVVAINSIEIRPDRMIFTQYLFTNGEAADPSEHTVALVEWDLLVEGMCQQKLESMEPRIVEQHGPEDGP